MRSTPVLRRSRRACTALVALAAIAVALPLAAADRTSQRAQFRAALAAAKKPPEGAWRKLAAGLDVDHYPLYPYIELAALRPRIGKLERAEVERFLERWRGTLPAQDLREAWLRELARRGDWKAYRATYSPSDDRDLQCNALLARIAADEKLDYGKDMQPVWQGERALPASCNAVLRGLRAQGLVPDAEVWEHLERAADAGQADAADDAAALLDGSERITADRIVAALREPAATIAKAKDWADEARTRDAVSYALVRYARRNSDAAETAWADIGARFKWSDGQKNRILNAIALYRATSYSPDALARLKALPAAADDDATREWRVRIALAGGDWAETLAALDRLSDTQKADARWRYLRARMLGKLGRDAEAAALYADVAREANFHGFLAADWSARPYSICPLTLAADAKTEAALAQQPDLERAFEFRELGMLPEARREWKFALGKLDASERRLAADHAYRRGWYDRAVFAFSADPETQRLYEQRFPLGLAALVKREAAAAGIDPSWAYGILRAESAWMTDAHSHADAYGLMQLLPGVAKKLAKAEKLPYSGAQDLFDPTLNVQLGTRFLGRMADAYDGSPWLASAAYNAGQAPVGRWLDARGSLDPDFFVETIPYKETREYVARVLAFSVIYDWRMNGDALALSARMPKVGQPYRTPDASTPRKEVVCAATAVQKPPADAPASDAPSPEAGGGEPAAPQPSSPSASR
ncbi:MAG: transglycosylase SLT domain-containing protein [Dokdonella sp.]|uniref:transglycosylase SLT domain-containing protein n=1 Tax=Dokdonella sp. TaxID=2291710 RepID=UPI003F7FE2CD